MVFDFQRPADRDDTYSVAALNQKARLLLEAGFGGVWVEAEVTEVTRARSGHVYFTLADPGGKAELRAVMWQGQAMRYGARIASGAAVRCHGRVTLYEARGTYQIVADRIEEAGAGLKARLLAELRARLTAEGLFDPRRKRSLPPYPACVGVVTSRSGAALHDIIKVTGRRFPVRIVLAHASVQGASAPAEIARALERLAALADVEVVIVGRGGGSAEDLDAFNSELVVRAVARHPCPVVSAVGHEIDVTLADLAADHRAATPSEAAELAVPDREVVAENLAALVAALGTGWSRRVAESRSRLIAAQGNLRAEDPRVRLRRGYATLARTRQALAGWPELLLGRAHRDLGARAERLARWPAPALARARGDSARLAASLHALSPLGSLSRGYAVVRRLPEKSIIRDAAAAPPDTEIDVTLARGSLVCTVRASRADSELDALRPETPTEEIAPCPPANES